MGGYENLVKIGEIKKKVEAGDLETAQKILDTMDAKKIKNVLDLNLLAEVYEGNGKYEEAKELYLKIYEKTHTRKALFKLINILIKLNDAQEAEYYYEQYESIAPDDFYKYIFRYYIEKIKGATYENLIGILEELKKQEYIEKWAYELAKLYYKAGMEEECIRECSDIVLWFGEGPYVEKAKILRSYYAGEADKEWIMRELKRRSKSVEGQEDYEAADGFTSDSNNITDGYTSDGYNNSDAFAPNGYTYTDYNDPEGNAYTDYNNLDGYEYAEYNTTGEGNYYYNEDAAYDEQGYAAYDTKEEAENTADNFDYDFRVNVQDYMDELSIYHGSENDGHNFTVTDEELVAENPNYEYIDNTQEEYDLFGWLEKEYDFNVYEVFNEFLQDESVKVQLVRCMENILSEESTNVMILITGAPESGKTSLAKKIAIFLNWIGRLQTSKLAKINADKLNTINIFTKKDVIKDCCLLIENASRLTEKTIEGIIELSRELPSALAVVFEDNVNNLNVLFGKYPILVDLIKNEIHLQL